MTNNKYEYYYNNKKYTTKQLINIFKTNSFLKHPNEWKKTEYGFKYEFKKGINKGKIIKKCYCKTNSKMINFDNVFYTIDIETSTFFNEKNVDWQYKFCNGVRTIKRINEVPPISIPYLIGVRKYNFNNFFNSPINDGYIKNIFDTENFKGYKALRTYEECKLFIEKIINESYENNTVTFLIIQNNAYEHSFLHSNVYCKLDYPYSVKTSYIKPHKPMKVEFFKNDKLCVRILDTYLLTSKSLKSYGELYGYLKLDKLDDYQSIYLPNSQLPEEEFIYNKRDLDLTALMFINVVKDISKSTNKEPNEILNNLYTKTGITRYKNKVLFNNNKINIIYNKNDMSKKRLNCLIDTFSDCNGNTKQQHIYEFNNDCFIGGYVRANEKTVYKIQNNVVSIDITSSYPYSMKSKLYGFNYKKAEDDFDKIKFLIRWKNKANLIVNNINRCCNLYFRNALMSSISSIQFFNCSLIIKNIKAKKMPNNNSMLLMSSSKLIDSVNCVVNNGRVVECEKAVINVSSVELLNYIFVYDFDIEDCSFFEYATMIEKLPKSTQETIDFYYKRKTDLKKLLKGFLNNNIINCLNSINNISLNDFEISYIEKHYKDNDFEIWLNQLLQTAKSDLNAQYGINVEKPNHDLITCSNNNVFTITTQKVNENILKRNFDVGMLITAWSRLHLILMSLILIKNGATIHYWDTDSIKYTSASKLDDVINNFNKAVGNYENCLSIGTYDFEYFKDKQYSYEKFVSLGSKNYWILNENKINFTVSGLVYSANTVVNDYFSKKCDYNFYQFVSEMLQPMTYFDGELIKSNLTDYSHSTEFRDLYIKNYHFKGFSGVIINLPQSRGILPYPSRFIESRYYTIYKKRPYPQLLTMISNQPDFIECRENNFKDVFALN